MLSHKNLVCNACQSIATARIPFEDRMLVFVPLYHIYGIMLMGCAAMAGARLVLMERVEAGRGLPTVPKRGITAPCTVPPALGVLAGLAPLGGDDLPTVRFSPGGAAPPTPPLG